MSGFGLRTDLPSKPLEVALADPHHAETPLANPDVCRGRLALVALGAGTGEESDDEGAASYADEAFATAAKRSCYDVVEAADGVTAVVESQARHAIEAGAAAVIFVNSNLRKPDRVVLLDGLLPQAARTTVGCISYASGRAISEMLKRCSDDENRRIEATLRWFGDAPSNQHR
jgi:hypothetical protein